MIVVVIRWSWTKKGYLCLMQSLGWSLAFYCDIARWYAERDGHTKSAIIATWWHQCRCFCAYSFSKAKLVASSSMSTHRRQCTYSQVASSALWMETLRQPRAVQHCMRGSCGRKDGRERRWWGGYKMKNDGNYFLQGRSLAITLDVARRYAQLGLGCYRMIAVVIRWYLTKYV